MGVNMTSVLKKVQNYMDSSLGKKINNQYMRRALLGDKTLTASGRGIYSLDRIGDLFEQCLVNEIINSKYLSQALKETIISSIDFFCYDYIAEYRTCFVYVYFSESYAGARPSLYPKGYPEGIDSLAALYNNGVDHIMNPVWGMWNGQRVASNPDIHSSQFVQNAVEDFEGNYSYDCNVINIEISEDLGRYCDR